MQRRIYCMYIIIYTEPFVCKHHVTNSTSTCYICALPMTKNCQVLG